MSGAVTAALLGGLAFAILVGADLAFGGRAFTTLGGVGLPVLMLIVSLLQLVFQYLASALRAHGRFRAVSLAGSLQALVGCALGIAMVTRWGALGAPVGLARRHPDRPRRDAPRAIPGPRCPRPARSRSRTRARRLPIFAYFAITLLLRSADRLALVRFAAPDSARALQVSGIMAAGLVVYVPEAAAFVLFRASRPRAAAAPATRLRWSRSRSAPIARSRSWLPFLVGTRARGEDRSVVARLLPHYREGVTALKALRIGALMLSRRHHPAATSCSAGPRRGRRSCAGGAIAAALSAMAVFAVAALIRRPLPVAIAGASGCALISRSSSSSDSPGVAWRRNAGARDG